MISDMLTVNTTPLGWWTMWCNDTVARLEKLKLRASRHITIKHEPTSYHLERDGWYCDHVSTSEVQVEVTDEYLETVTGEPQPTHYYSETVCDNCHEVL
jgi:hypothetical protein